MHKFVGVLDKCGKKWKKEVAIHGISNVRQGRGNESKVIPVFDR